MCFSNTEALPSGVGGIGPRRTNPAAPEASRYLGAGIGVIPTGTPCTFFPGTHLPGPPPARFPSGSAQVREAGSGGLDIQALPTRRSARIVAARDDARALENQWGSPHGPLACLLLAQEVPLVPPHRRNLGVRTSRMPPTVAGSASTGPCGIEGLAPAAYPRACGQGSRESAAFVVRR